MRVSMCVRVRICVFMCVFACVCVHVFVQPRANERAWHAVEAQVWVHSGGFVRRREAYRAPPLPPTDSLHFVDAKFVALLVKDSEHVVQHEDDAFRRPAAG